MLYSKISRSSQRICSVEKSILKKASKNSEENTCVGVSFLTKLQISGLQLRHRCCFVILKLAMVNWSYWPWFILSFPYKLFCNGCKTKNTLLKSSVKIWRLCGYSDVIIGNAVVYSKNSFFVDFRRHQTIISDLFWEALIIY